MKSAERFWEVIQVYNQATLTFQIMIVCFILFSVFAAYRWQKHYLPKLALSVANLFIAIVFFLVFDGSTVARYFAFPLYLAMGCLLLVDAVGNREAGFAGFDMISTLCLILVLSYPLVSFLLGHRYPGQVLYILPCPVVALGIVIYSRYERKSSILLILMTLWALTGLKAFVFNVMEDLILFATAFYGIYLVISDMRRATPE